MEISEILDIRPYSLNKPEKEQLLSSYLTELSRYHYNHCLPYKKMMDSVNYDINKEYSYYDLPFLPVRLFKMFDLYSVGQEEIIKTMTSSGTSGQVVSKIYLDRETSNNQTKALTKIVSSFIGKQRLPIIIIDSENAVKNRTLFSARGAG
ncbi:MAG: acyl-protein synthetase, partial [Bacteroidales bacterium]|nr:acyl-protein synthetase [Bacteroidales bacterium]